MDNLQFSDSILLSLSDQAILNNAEQAERAQMAGQPQDPNRNISHTEVGTSPPNNSHKSFGTNYDQQYRVFRQLQQIDRTIEHFESTILPAGKNNMFFDPSHGQQDLNFMQLQHGSIDLFQDVSMAPQTMGVLIQQQQMTAHPSTFGNGMNGSTQNLPAADLIFNISNDPVHFTAGSQAHGQSIYGADSPQGIAPVASAARLTPAGSRGRLVTHPDPVYPNWAHSIAPEQFAPQPKRQKQDKPEPKSWCWDTDVLNSQQRRRERSNQLKIVKSPSGLKIPRHPNRDRAIEYGGTYPNHIVQNMTSAQATSLGLRTAASAPQSQSQPHPNAAQVCPGECWQAGGMAYQGSVQQHGFAIQMGSVPLSQHYNPFMAPGLTFSQFGAGMPLMCQNGYALANSASSDPSQMIGPSLFMSTGALIPVTPAEGQELQSLEMDPIRSQDTVSYHAHNGTVEASTSILPALALNKSRLPMNGTSINPIIVADEEVDDLYHVYERVSPVGLQNDEKETQYAEPKLAPASLPVEPIAKEGEEAVTGAERHDELTWSFDDFLNTTASVGLFRSGTTVV
jgi:hypothetical protein